MQYFLVFLAAALALHAASPAGYFDWQPMLGKIVVVLLHETIMHGHAWAWLA